MDEEEEEEEEEEGPTATGAAAPGADDGEEEVAMCQMSIRMEGKLKIEPRRDRKNKKGRMEAQTKIEKSTVRSRVNQPCFFWENRKE